MATQSVPKHPLKWPTAVPRTKPGMQQTSRFGQGHLAAASGLGGRHDTRHHMLVTFDIAAEPVRTVVAAQGELHD